MRDALMNEQYFSEYIQEETQRLDKFASKLQNNEVREDRIYSVRKKVDAIKFGLLVAKYSYGEDVGKLESEFIELLNDMPLYWDENSSYVDMLWMMSMAVLFDVSKEQFCVLSDLVEKYNRNDAVLKFLTNYKVHGVVGEIEGHFSFGFPYDKLAGIVEDKKNCTDWLKEYLQKYWYIGHKDMGWYDIHKAKEKLYYGYWSFEAGAIAKILNIDDDGLKNIRYYPYDLVHYRK